MCLATVYNNEDDSVLFRNVAKIEIDGDHLQLTDILGDVREIEGRILMADLANSVVKVLCA